MREIQITKGASAIVDDADYDCLSKYSWYLTNNGYARTTECLGTENGVSKVKRISMHRLVAATPVGMETDHINGNKLDNRRENLRICTGAENRRYQKPQIGCSSKYKGVYWHKGREKWIAHIRINNVRKHLGRFMDEKKAAMAYNVAAIKYHREFAILNYI